MSFPYLSLSTAPNGTPFRDLNGNGVMEPYENPTLSVTERVADLIGRMTLEEKVGQLFQRSIEAGEDGSLVEEGARQMPESTSSFVRDRLITHFNVVRLPAPEQAARWQNNLQKLAESTRLGIPVTLSTDPRHAVLPNENEGAALPAGAFSAWPEGLGLAALQDVDTVREFAEYARREYLAVGVRAALHPQVDLATEPRWARQSTTFGPDARLSSAYVHAYLDGFQQLNSAGALGPDSVACMTKHFPGGGPQKDGEDPHFPYGAEQIYPGGMFEYHLEPFRAAVAAGTSAIMPYYGKRVGLVRNGKPIEEVAFGYNKQIITGILRDELEFDGVICTDWQLVTGFSRAVNPMPARAWGVEHLDRAARVAKILDAGCDQLGGENCTDVLLRLVHDGRVAESRIDESLARVLRVKFELGLFDNPYVDEAAAAEKAGTADAVAAGHAAQKRSCVMLRGRSSPALPLTAGTSVYLDGIDAGAASGRLVVVDDAAADLRLVRLDGPFDKRDEYFLEPVFHAGTLECPPEVIDRVRNLSTHGPVALVVRLERPAVLTPLVEVADIVLGEFGTTDRAIFDVLAEPDDAQGKLPFDLPATVRAVHTSKPDVPHDLEDVLFEHAGEETPC